MDERFIRNLGALDEEECALLRTKKVFIAGCGGIGGYLAEYLLRLGVGEISVCDAERFDMTNLNRQLLCTERNVGRLKASEAALRAERVAPDTPFYGHVCRLDADNLPGLLRGCDAVLDALDTAEDKKLLKRACDALGLPYFFGAVGGWVAQAALSLPGDDLPEIIYPQGYEPQSSGVLSFTPALCAAMQAALCVRYLCGREVESGRLYSFDLLEMELRDLRL